MHLLNYINLEYPKSKQERHIFISELRKKKLLVSVDKFPIIKAMETYSVKVFL